MLAAYTSLTQAFQQNDLAAAIRASVLREHGARVSPALQKTLALLQTHPRGTDLLVRDYDLRAAELFGLEKQELLAELARRQADPPNMTVPQLRFYVAQCWQAVEEDRARTSRSGFAAAQPDALPNARTLARNGTRAWLTGDTERDRKTLTEAWEVCWDDYRARGIQSWKETEIRGKIDRLQSELQAEEAAVRALLPKEALNLRRTLDPGGFPLDA
jgi:hypothetical protein